jgi:hypothetical protein
MLQRGDVIPVSSEYVQPESTIEGLRPDIETPPPNFLAPQDAPPQPARNPEDDYRAGLQEAKELERLFLEKPQ